MTDNFEDPRWNEIKRPYTLEEAIKLRGSLKEEHTLADVTSKKLWELLNSKDYVHAMGAVTGNQAMQMVKAGMEAIYCSGWQVAADANDSHAMYPDQSLYAVHSVPMLVQKINSALRRADQIEFSENGQVDKNWFAPIIADAEAGFGGPLNAFELMKSMIKAGAAGVHFEDQLSSAKKCGHLGGKVLVPGSEFIKKLAAARLAADVMGVGTVLIARTDANSARLLTSDIDAEDEAFVLGAGNRTSEGFHRITGGIDMAISRGLRYAPYADLLWCETGKPDLDEARRFAEAIHEKFPNKLLAYNCSPSFNWKKNLDDETIAKFQKELGNMGYKFQFITLAGFHNLNYHMFKLAQNYENKDMTAYSELQEKEFAAEPEGYTATKHQREVGTGYFDLVAQTIASGDISTLALEESTETEQF